MGRLCLNEDEIFPTTTLFFADCGELYFGVAEVFGGGYGYGALAFVVDGAVVVVGYAVVVDKVTLVGIAGIVVLGGVDEVVAMPVVPMHEVAAAGKGVVGFVGTVGAEGAEIEHHIEVADFLNVGVTRNGAFLFVGHYGVAVVACPVGHVVG